MGGSRRFEENSQWNEGPPAGKGHPGAHRQPPHLSLVVLPPGHTQPACPLRQVTGDDVSASRDPRFLRWVAGAPLQLRGPRHCYPLVPVLGILWGPLPGKHLGQHTLPPPHFISEGTPARDGAFPSSVPLPLLERPCPIPPPQRLTLEAAHKVTSLIYSRAARV